ncbi:unnamed protein product [Amoebophrya sp. A120]|nr:unnamed protein product [Amoebophrya sp. A120]|eukprot:GSA120T00002788001.1
MPDDKPVGSNRSASAPVLQRFSQYEAGPRYSVTGKWKVIERNQNIPAANKYDVREMTKHTSKYGQLTYSCSFGSAKRWARNYGDNTTGGPGQYETARSTIRRSDISFGKSTRPDITGLPKSIPKCPGPGQYEVRDKNNKNDPTLSTLTIKFAGRHNWFYENPEDDKRPGPGKYSLNFTQVEEPVGTETKIGTGLRPSMESHLGVNPKAPGVGPGQYKVQIATFVMRDLVGYALFAFLRGKEIALQITIKTNNETAFDDTGWRHRDPVRQRTAVQFYHGFLPNKDEAQGGSGHDPAAHAVPQGRIPGVSGARRKRGQFLGRKILVSNYVTLDDSKMLKTERWWFNLQCFMRSLLKAFVIMGVFVERKVCYFILFLCIFHSYLYRAVQLGVVDVNRGGCKLFNVVCMIRLNFRT